ncbi:MAG: choice-of-anchor D domain-containing protein, partial [Gemmatimonadaceae bacterium]
MASSIAIAIALLGSAAGAQTAVTWTALASNNWKTTGFWTGLAGGDLYPNNGANTYTVTIAANAGQNGTTSVVLDQTTGAPGNTVTVSGLALAPVLDINGNPAAELVLGTGMTLNAGNLTNFSGTTLSGGRYFIDGTFRFNNANIHTLAVGTTLIMDNANAHVYAATGTVDALANLSNNAGTFDIRNGYNHSAVTNFNNSGTVSVSEGSTFATQGVFTNTGTLLASGTIGTSTIAVSSTVLANAGGTLIAGNNGQVAISGSTINGGALTTSGNGVVTFTNNASNFLSGVAVNGKIDMTAATGAVRVVNGLTMSGGTISLDKNSVVAFQGTQSLSGTGSILFGSDVSNALALDNSNAQLTIGSGIFVHGQNGSIGAQRFIGSNGTVIVNNGTISADVNTGTLTLTQAIFNNNNILDAKNGGLLNINTTVNNSGTGKLTASNNGTLLMNAAAVNGGTISTTSGGRFVATNNANNFLNDATLNGRIDLASATGSIRVNGSTGLTMQAGSIIDINQNSVLAFNGSQTLGGTGSVVFGNTGSSNRVAIDNSGAVLTIGANARIRGENGTIGTQVYVGSNNTSITNNGHISADVSGGTITIAQATVTNNGVLEAQNGGTLVLSSNVTGGAGGQILAGAGSTVIQNGVTLSGIINTSGAGSFRPTNNANNFLDAVTLSGTLDMASTTGSERVLNGLTLNGNVNVNNNSVLAFQGTQTLGGNGSIVFGNTGSSNAVAVDASGSELTIGANMHIRGENGTVGAQYYVGSNGTNILNNGHISADVAGGTINITQATITNNGTLEALNGGTLVLSSNVTGTANGQIFAGAGSTVLQNGIKMSGIVNSSGSGVLRATNNSANFFDGVTLNGNLDLATATGTDRVINGLVLNGNVNINQNSVFAFQGTQTVSGTGTIVLGNTGSSNRVALDQSNSVLTIGSGVTIRGENGTVGTQNFVGSNNTTIANNGHISADVNGGTLTLTQAVFSNNATLEAKNGGLLNINAVVNNTANGVVGASNNGVALLNGVAMTGGTITTTTGGRFVATNSAANFLNDVTVNGKIDLATATASVRVAGTTGMTMLAGSTIDINNNSVLVFQGDQALSGTGSILFGNTGSSNHLAIDQSNATLTIGSGILVHGVNGTIGTNQYVGTNASHLVNNGIINSDGGGLITIAPGLLASVVNNGTLRAQNGTLSLGLPVTGTGILQVDATGILNMSGSGANVQDKLIIGSTGAALNTANQNITINKDYTNASAGSGNTFVKRAGVNGSGAINAGGNTAQAITGTGVTNGTTSNATLTIGNVRVGTSTYNYQIANTGTVGADLRGAVQTSVNGGNITDARLGGGGIAAGLYGPIATTFNSGDRAVTFNAATAGALSPLTGQAINLRSVYDNLADQKLNIALSANAAAYNVAVGSTTPAPINIGNTRVNGTLAGNLTVANTAAAGGFSEKLDASFGANTGAAGNNGGAVSLLAAGSTNNSAMGVTLTTATSGAKTGTVKVNYVSNGTGTSGLDNLAVGSQDVTVNGNVFQTAAGTLNSTPLNFGTVQVGQSVSKTLSISNSATGAAGFVEDLNAAFGSKTGTGTSLFSGTGSINGLLAGATNTTGMTVNVNTAAAGTINGSIRVNYTSAGAVNGISNGLGTLSVGGSDFGVSGDIQASASVVNAASPVINNSPINLGN